MAAELSLRLTGGAVNTDPDASLGGVMSSEVVSVTALNNLFDDIEVTEATDGDTEYRAVDLYNIGDATAVGVEIWFSSDSASADTAIYMGLDVGVQSIADESTAPADGVITFTQPTSGARLAIADIAAAGSQRIWFRRICNALAGNYANDICGIVVRYA